MISSLYLYGVNGSFPLKSAFVSLGFYKNLYLCLIDNIVRYRNDCYVSHCSKPAYTLCCVISLQLVEMS